MSGRRYPYPLSLRPHWFASSISLCETDLARVCLLNQVEKFACWTAHAEIDLPSDVSIARPLYPGVTEPTSAQDSRLVRIGFRTVSSCGVAVTRG